MTEQELAGEEASGDIATDAGDYSAVYYHSYSGPPYTYEEPHWKKFFGGIAESVVALFGPSTSYDAGCAKGFLVRELAARGVDARGGDISDSAISDAPPGLAERLEVRDLTQPFDGRYDLISCIEVLEHMSAHDAQQAIANMCAATDLVLLSSTPDGFAEPTHVNVRQPAGWAQDFAVHGFFRRTDVDASFLSPWAVVLQRTEVTTAELATRYEGHLAALSREVLEKRRALLDAQRLVDEQSAPALVESAALRAEADTLRAEIARLHAEDIAGLHAEIASLRSADVLADSAAKLAILDEVIGLRAELAEAKVEQENYAEPLRQELADARTTIETLTGQLAGARAEIGSRPAGGAFGASRTVTEAVAAKEAEMKGSRTWRIGRLVIGPAAALGASGAPVTAPMFSVLVPVYRTPLRYLRLMVDSVLAQRFSDFQLLLVDDGSGRPELTAELAGMAARDERIELLPQAVNAGIVRASAAGLAAATGEFVALVDHDDELLPDALELFARAILADDQLDYLYSDEAIIDPEGALLGNFVKPDFSPTRLLGQMYTGHLAVFRRSLLTEIGGFRDGFDGSQDYDLVLRASERARVIGHIPKALYRWRTLPTSVSHSANNEHVFAAARRALTEHLDRTATVAQVVQTDSTGRYRLDRPLPDELRVDVILPCTGGRTFARGADRPALAAALDAVAAAGAGLDDLGAVVIGAPGAAVDCPSSWPGRWLTVEHPHPAGPAAVNRAVAASSAEYVVLALEGLAGFGAQADGNRALSGARAEGGDRADVVERAESGDPAAVGERAETGDRAEVGDQGELTRLVALAADRRIGAVGPQLVDGGGRLSSAGVTFAAMLPAPIGRGCDLDDPGPFGALQVDRDVLALAPGVLVINRSLYLQVGGLSVRMTLAAAWLDLCFKTAAMDRRTVVCADARAVFDRPAALPEPASAAELGERWRRAVARDPYWV